MKTTPTKPSTIRLRDIEPINVGLVEDICNYLDRIQTRITRQTESRHVRLLAIRPPFISNTQVHVIRTAFFGGDVDHPPLARWQRDSVILWERELIEAEVFSSASPTSDMANTSPVGPSRDCPYVLPH